MKIGGHAVICLQVKAVQEYLEDLLDQDQKFLVFYHHKVMGEGLQEVLNK